MMNSSLFAQMGRVAAGAVVLLGLGACSTPEETEAAQGWWIGDRVEGSPRLSIDLDRQVVKYFKGGKLVGAAPISSGREGYGTVRGQYRILDKDADHRSSIYGSFVDNYGRIVEGDVDSRRDSPPAGTHFLGASMRSFMRITGGIGMHEGYLPGFAASHGCIRLPSKMAAIFFRATPVGTPVEIVGNAPDGHLTTWLPVPHKLRPEDIVIAPKQEEDTRPKAIVALAEPPAPPKPVEKPAPKKVEVAAAESSKGSFWSGLFGSDDAAATPAMKKPAKPEPVAAVASAPAPGQTQFLDSKPKPQPAKTVAAAAEPKKGSFWSGMFGSGESEAPAAPAAKPAKPAPVVAAAPAPEKTRFVTPQPAPQPKKIEVASAQPKKGSFWGGLFAGDAEAAPAPARSAKTAPAPAPVIVAAPPPQKPAVKAAADEPQKISYQPLASLNKPSSSWGWTKKPAAPQPAKPSRKAPAVRGQTYFLPGYN